MDKGCNGGVPCPDGLVRAGDQKLHVSFAVLCIDFENVRRKFVYCSKTQFKGAGGGGGG